MKKKNAFTLAEVLITLGIIGIVAAITLPIIIQKQQEKSWVTAYLRVYSILENAYRIAQIDNGTYEGWSGVTITQNSGDGKFDRNRSDGQSVYNIMIKSNVKVIQSYLDSKHRSRTCWPDKSFLLTGKGYTTNFDGESRVYVPTIALPSGECIMLGHGFGDFMVDLNGRKNPNTLGKDQFIFSFDVLKPNRIKPGYYQRWWTDTYKYCLPAPASWHEGTSCGFWILRNHNMDYLHMTEAELKKKWNGGVW